MCQMYTPYNQDKQYYQDDQILQYMIYYPRWMDAEQEVYQVKLIYGIFNDGMWDVEFRYPMM